MITTTEIPRRDWVSFLDSLSRKHLEEPIRVEVLRLDIGAQLEVRDMPLDGIVADLKGPTAAITVAAGADPDGHIAHVISEPVSLRLAHGVDSDEETLEIVSADHTITLVFFDERGG